MSSIGLSPFNSTLLSDYMYNLYDRIAIVNSYLANLLTYLYNYLADKIYGQTGGKR